MEEPRLLHPAELLEPELGGGEVRGGGVGQVEGLELVNHLEVPLQTDLSVEWWGLMGQLCFLISFPSLNYFTLVCFSLLFQLMLYWPTRCFRIHKFKKVKSKRSCKCHFYELWLNFSIFFCDFLCGYKKFVLKTSIITDY